jgi:hypothetical protein
MWYLAANPRQFAAQKKTVRCRVVPVFSAAYLAARRRWLDTRELLGAFNTSRFVFPNTTFPWHPCADPRAYRDNEVLVYVPAASTSVDAPTAMAAITTSTSPAQPTLDSIAHQRITSELIHRSSHPGVVMNRAAERTRAGLLSLATTELETAAAAAATTGGDTRPASNLPSDSVVLLACEQVASWIRPNAPPTFAEPAHQTRAALTAALSTLAQSPVGNVTLHIDPAAAELHSWSTGDACQKAWGALRIRADVTAATAAAATTLTYDAASALSAPTIQNPLAHPASPVSLPRTAQCRMSVMHDIITRIERPEYVSHVHAYHPCVGDGKVAFGVDYQWQFIPHPRPSASATRCINSGQVVHTWKATACGQQAVDLVRTIVADTIAPTLPDRHPSLQLSPDGSTVYYTKCDWLSRASQMFCPAVEVPKAIRALAHDNCDTRDDLVLNIEWAQARFLLCTEEKCAPLTGAAEAALATTPGALPRCLSSAQLAVPRQPNAALQYVVPLTIADTCGNVMQRRVMFTTTFVDPTSVAAPGLRKLYCHA